MRMVYIEWYDPASETDNDWTPIKDCEGVLGICSSLGFVIKETDISLTVAGHIEADDFCGEITIPKACIIKIKELNNGGSSGLPVGLAP